MSGFLVIFCTCATESDALALARALVEKRLAACANVLPGIQSIYPWDGEVRFDSECLLLLKTTEDCFDALRDALLELHSYSNPEIIALPVHAGADKYLAWIRSSVYS